MRWKVKLEKTSKSRTNQDKASEKLRELRGALEGPSTYRMRARASLGRLEAYQGGYRQTATVEVTKVSGPEDVARKQFADVYKRAEKLARDAGWACEWAEEEDRPLTRPRFVVPPLTELVFETHFGNIYGRDAQIRLLHDSLSSYADTLNRRSDGTPVARSHVLLKGRPAGCKTTIFERFKAWLEEGETVERFALLDGPTLSKAGLENWLIERAEAGTLPEVLCVEEVEKQNMDNLLTLLSLMSSGYVSKLNARVNVRAAADCVVWATCNSEEALSTFRGGALYSRFTHKIHCPRPGREVIERVLADRVAASGGDPRWADEAARFAFEELPRLGLPPLADPRQVIGLLDGRNRLLDGSFQRDLLCVMADERSCL